MLFGRHTSRNGSFWTFRYRVQAIREDLLAGGGTPDVDNSAVSAFLPSVDPHFTVMPASVTGTVTAEDTGLPLEGVWVEARWSGGSAGAYTDANGMYAIVGIPVDSFDVWVDGFDVYSYRVDPQVSVPLGPFRVLSKTM